MVKFSPNGFLDMTEYWANKHPALDGVCQAIESYAKYPARTTAASCPPGFVERDKIYSYRWGSNSNSPLLWYSAHKAIS